MAKIVIKDLPESVDLDRKAMLAVIGGARTRGRQALPLSTQTEGNRIVNYPRGFARTLTPGTGSSQK